MQSNGYDSRLFGYPCHIVIFIVLKRKASFCVVAKIWLKRNYISESYWRRWEKWKKVRNERKREEGRGRKVKKSHSFGKCARRILEATLGKSVILPRFITLFGCSVTLPLALPAKIHSFRRRGSGAQGSRLAQGYAWQKCDFAALYYTLLCKCIAKRLAEKTNKLLRGLIRGGAPRAPGHLSFIDFAVPRRRFLDFFPHCI